MVVLYFFMSGFSIGHFGLQQIPEVVAMVFYHRMHQFMHQNVVYKFFGQAHEVQVQVNVVLMRATALFTFQIFDKNVFIHKLMQ